MLIFLLTIYEVVLFISVCLVLYPIALLLFIITTPFDKKKIVLHRYSCFWGSLYIWLQPLWKVSWEGKEHIKKNQSYIFVSNHQTVIDILVIYTLFKHFKWVAKNSLLKTPFIGWNMALNGYIIVKRSNAKNYIKMMKQAEFSLKTGNSIMIFPEGTRSSDGKLGRFKRGAFILSEIADVPVIPIALHNVDKAIRKNSIWINKATDMKAKVFEPIYFKDFKNTIDMSVAAKETIANQLEKWRE